MTDDDYHIPAPYSDGGSQVLMAIVICLLATAIFVGIKASEAWYADLRQPTLAPCHVGPSHPCVIPSDAGDLVIYTASYSGGTYWAATPSPRPDAPPTPRPARNP